MNRVLVPLAALGLLFACTPEENNTGNDNGNDGIVHVTGITLDRPTANIKEGGSFTLVATVTPENADNKNVIWASSSDAVATVDNNGKVTGVKAGSATITATAEDGGMKAACALSVEANLPPSVTVEANHISAISAVLAGKANLGSTAASDLIVGFQYSKSTGILPSNSTTVEATDADADYNYTTGITGLEPDTKYYFRSFVRQNGQDTCGETKSFTTKDVSSLMESSEASGVEATKATMNAKLDLTDVQYKSLSYGFFWGSSESALNLDYKCTEIKDNAISATLTSLPHKTQYWYKAYVNLDEQTFYGDVKTFTTSQWVTSIRLSRSSLLLYIGNEITISVISVLPGDANDKTYTWSSSDNSIAAVDQNGKITAKASGNAVIKATANDGSGVFASCAVVVVKEPYTSVAGEAVDLGLSVKWSSMNLGATLPTDYGDYFAWGETAPKDNYTWATYKLCNGDSFKLTKYNFSSSYGTVDNKTEFKDYNYEDDAARQALGGKWRIPSDVEWAELRTSCTWTWINDYNGSGVNGRLVTASNGNSIFLPAAGYRGCTSLNSAGYFGEFWSSSLYTDNLEDAWLVYFDPSDVYRSYGFRYCGSSVRPVTE